MGFIYMYTSPSNKRYIGQTRKTPKDRSGDSYGHSYKNCTAFYHAIQHYGGLTNFNLEILEECENELLDSREGYYINKYNTQSPNGYNLTAGGNTPNSFREQAVCQYDIQGNFIAKYDSLTKAAHAVGCAISTISQVCSGKKASVKGYRWAFEGQKPSKKRTKQRIVYCFDLEGNYMREFESVRNAAHFYDLPDYVLYQCANKKLKTAGHKLIASYEPELDTKFYFSNRGSTTIPIGSTPKRAEVLCSEQSDEDIV